MNEEQQQPQPQPAQPVQGPPPQPQAPVGQPVGPEAPMQFGVSASQMGLNEPKKAIFDLDIKKKEIKKWVIIGLFLLVVTIVALIFSGIIVFSEFKTVKYTNNNETKYTVEFYSRHFKDKSSSGQNQLTSRVEKDGKFPLIFFISSSDGKKAYEKVKECDSYTKEFTVKIHSLATNINVCSLVTSVEGSGKGGIYLAAFLHNDQSHLITFGQDLSGADLSSKSDAKRTLTQFGFEPYQDDIKKIIGSIKVLDE